MARNGITDITRRQIADEMTIGNILYHGGQTEPDFLARLFDLKSLPSGDYRYLIYSPKTGQVQK
jgi:hypothetical protein